MVVILFQFQKAYYKTEGFGEVDLCWRPTNDGQKPYYKLAKQFLKQKFGPVSPSWLTSRKAQQAICLPALANDYFVF